MLLHNSPQNKLMKVLQYFSGSLLPNVLLDKENYECGLLEGQFVTGLESKFHIPTPKLESKVWKQNRVCDELSGKVKKKYLSVY